MNWSAFELGFWHPFGVHGGEQRDEILVRKTDEIVRNDGWTLWSFQHRRMIPVWQNTLSSADVGKTFALCSDSPLAAQPRGAVRHSTEYRASETGEWLPIPSAIRIPHPFGGRELASAFVVEGIDLLGERENQPTFGIAWMSSRGTWREDRLPTRGEYLIKRGGVARLRPVYAVLTLRPPFVVWVRA